MLVAKVTRTVVFQKRQDCAGDCLGHTSEVADGFELEILSWLVLGRPLALLLLEALVYSALALWLDLNRRRGVSYSVAAARRSLLSR